MTKFDDIGQLFRIHYATMYRLARLIMRDDSVSRDIVHDVFEALLVSGLANVSEAYLMKAVRNRCLKQIRSLSAQDRMREIYSIDKEEIADEDWSDDTTIALIQAIVANNLTDACQRVVSLRFSDGKSYQEIADIIGISKVAVYKHLRHAIDTLRQKLSENG